MRVEKDYRLGNIIDAWYGREFVQRKACDFVGMVARNQETFGNFLATETPSDCPSHLREDNKFIENATEWWWCYFYDNHRSIYPHFTNSLRDAITKYGKIKPPTTPHTLVIHLRVGDFLRLQGTLDVHHLVQAIDLLKSTPDTVEIMNGGARFNCDSKTFTESNELIQKLLEMVSNKLPEANVKIIESDNADDDFFRMVNAPMLITGAGSYAVIAAAANRGQRLTPALKNMNFTHFGTEPCTHVFEDWHTYAC